MPGPTIAHAEVKVDFDGRRLPAEARALGKQTGDDFAKEHNRQRDDVLNRGWSDLGNRMRDEMRTRGRMAGRAGGRETGSAFDKALREHIRANSRTTTRELARIFSDTDGLDKYRRKLYDTDNTMRSLNGTIGRLRGHMENQRRDGKLTRANIDEMNRALVAWRRRQNDLDRDTTTFGGRLRSLSNRLRETGDSARIGGDAFRRLSDDVDRLRIRTSDAERNNTRFGRALSGLGRIIPGLRPHVGGLGDDMRRLNRDTDNSNKAFSKLFGSFRNFDPFDNVGQLILLIIALGAPLAVLLTSLAAGLVVLGSAALSAVGGLVVFVGILKSILGMQLDQIKELPKDLQKTVLAFQDLIGQVDKFGNFHPGKLFTELGKGLAAAFLGAKNFDEILKTFTDRTVPALNAALRPIARVLGEMFAGLLQDLGSDNALAVIHRLSVQIADQLPKIGRIASNVGGIIVELFFGASQATGDFLDDLGQVTEDFLKFLRSPEGQTAMKDWFEDSMRTLGQLGDTLGELTQAIIGLATPENVAETIKLLKQLGDAGPKITQLMDDLNKVAGAIAGVIDVLASLSNAFFFVMNGIDEFGKDFEDLGTTLQIYFDQMVPDLIGAFVDFFVGSFALLGKVAVAFGEALWLSITGHPEEAKEKIGSALAGIVKDWKGISDTFEGHSKKMQGAWDRLTDAGRQAADEAKNHIEAFGLMGKAASDYIATLQNVPPEAKTILVNDAINAGQRVTDYKSAIESLPDQQAFEIITNAAAQGQAVGLFAGIIERLPEKQQFDILTNAAKAGGDLKGLQGVISQLPPQKLLQVLTTALAAGADVKDLQGIVAALKGKNVPIDASTREALVKSAALQTMIDSIRQKKSPTVAVNNTRGVLGAKDLQGAIDRIKQGKVPGIAANSASGKATVKALQAAINAIKQGKQPSLGANPGPAFTGVRRAQDAIDGLKGKTVFLTTIYRRQGGASSVGHSGGFSDGFGGYELQHPKHFANGGVNQRDGMIAVGGANITWAEPETGWEAYISGKAGKSRRNISVLQEAARRLGVDVSGGPERLVVVEAGAVQVNEVTDSRTAGQAAIDRLANRVG